MECWKQRPNHSNSMPTVGAQFGGPFLSFTHHLASEQLDADDSITARIQPSWESELAKPLDYAERMLSSVIKDQVALVSTWSVVWICEGHRQSSSMMLGWCIRFSSNFWFVWLVVWCWCSGSFLVGWAWFWFVWVFVGFFCRIAMTPPHFR